MNTKFSRDIAREALFKIKKELTKKDFSAMSPAPFIGRFGYPNINVGVLSPTEIKDDTWLYDAPKYWAKNNYNIAKIVDYRSALINSRFSVNIKQTSKFIDIAKEVAMAQKPVELEINLKEKPHFALNSDRINTLAGPNAKLKKAKITQNSKISFKVDKVVDDSDLKAENAIDYLYKSGYSENFLTKILSVGVIGLKNNRKLVPTRWSITATDDIIGKKLIKEIRDYNETEYMAYFGGYLGNYYLVLTFPEVFSFELFEMGVPIQINPWSKSNKFYATDFEDVNGRKNYASETAGGYYAARLPVLEKLKQIKKKASVLVFRFITDEYEMPLGVFVVREACRKAVMEKPIKFGSKELLLNYAKHFTKQKFGVELEQVLRQSKLLKNIKTQNKLTQFIKEIL